MKLIKKLQKKPIKHKRLIAVSAAATLFLLLFLAFRWLTEWRFFITTDDAYVGGDITAIASKLPAYIKTVAITANQTVQKDDILFVLDDGDYRLALADAEARLITQQRSLERIQTQIAAAQANLREAQAAYNAAQAVSVNAKQSYDRAAALQKQQFAAQAKLDAAQAENIKAQANQEGAQAKIENTQANIAVLQAQYKEAESQTVSLRLARDKAARDARFTVIRAPIDGIVGNLTGKTGDFVANGQRLAALVPSDQLYIDANYKETQLANIYGGETALISVDGYDGGDFQGTVLSLAPATGAVFSVLPPQNATGNFTKVVQRIPVRIAIPPALLTSGRLRAGMSATVKIDSRSRPQNAVPIQILPVNAGEAPIAAQKTEVQPLSNPAAPAQ